MTWPWALEATCRLCGWEFYGDDWPSLIASFTEHFTEEEAGCQDSTSPATTKR